MKICLAVIIISIFAVILLYPLFIISGGESRLEEQNEMRRNAKKLHNHLGTNHTQMVKDTIALVPEANDKATDDQCE